MGWLLFESLVAFAILVAIVLWTMGPLRKRTSRRDGDEDRDAAPPE
ncbi:MAG TPA: hypothetical protein VJX31_07230 [Casimicrobiaceae bacterium]|nr:hypothetical protein [Casimicrobiaceae bacterium]